MGYNRNKRGDRGRDKWDNFGGEPQAEGFKAYNGDDAPRSAPRSFDNDRPRGGAGGGAGGGMPAQVVGTSTGEVKFFNGQKGFGFICCDDRPDDVFVHISAVEQAGLQGLGEGQKLSFTLVERNGRTSATELEIVGDIVPVQSSSAPSSRPPAQTGPRHGADRPQRARRELTGESDTGTVKFFNGEKGFGFIERDSGKDDAFVHISTVERDGLGQLNEGDRLQFDIEVNDRGKHAAVNLHRA